MDVSGIERVSFAGSGGGVDRFNIGDLKGTGIAEVDIELRALDGAGDGASDTVSLTGLAARNDHLDVHVTGFEVHGGAPQGDVIQLVGFAEHTFIEAVAHQHIMQSGDDVLIADGTGLIVTLQGVSLTSLGASDFLFG